jgi:P4 family phage/plasmid primase-like protien
MNNLTIKKEMTSQKIMEQFKKSLYSITDEKTFKFKFHDTMVERMKVLWSIDYSTFVETIWDKTIHLNTDKWYNNPKTYYERLKPWLKSFVFPNPQLTMEKTQTYKYARNKTGGRIYVEGFGFQSLHKKIRNFLFHGLDYYDYDIKNCHFNILNNIVKQLVDAGHLTTPTILSKYCENRDGCLKSWNCSKQEVLRMLNKDTFYPDREDNGWLVDFHKELSPIKLLIIETFPNICGNTTNQWNPISSRVDYLLNFVENKILQKVMAHFGNASCPFFDGYIADSKLDIADINHLTTDFGVEWAIKPFDNELGDLMDKINQETYKSIGTNKKECSVEFFEWLPKASQNNIAEYFYDHCDEMNYIYYSKGKTKLFFEYNEFNILTEHNKRPVKLGALFTKFYEKTLKYHFAEISKTTDPGTDKYKQYFKTLETMWVKVGKNTFKTQTLNELLSFIEDNKILDKIDRFPHLLAFQDGTCVDFKEGIKRTIVKSDFISNHLPYDYPKQDTKTELWLHKTLYKLFEDQELYNYVLDSLGYALFTNKFETFNIWTGKGSNGKSVLMTLAQKAFGKYSYTCSTSFLGMKTSGTFDENLVNLVGKKIAWVSEPDNNTFNMEKIKSITGRDEQSCRDVGKSNITFTPEFTMYCICNDIPGVDRMDHSIKRRPKVTPFKFKFCAEPEPDTNERQIDTLLKDKIQEVDVYSQFTKILIDRVIHKYNIDIEIPDQVSLLTAAYFEENNIVKQFIDDKFDKVDDKDTAKKWNFISSVRAFELFEYYTSGEDKRLTKTIFSKNMEDNGYRKKKINITKNNKRTSIQAYTGLVEKSDGDSDNDTDDDDDHII